MIMKVGISAKANNGIVYAKDSREGNKTSVTNCHIKGMKKEESGDRTHHLVLIFALSRDNPRDSSSSGHAESVIFLRDS